MINQIIKTTAPVTLTRHADSPPKRDASHCRS